MAEEKPTEYEFELEPGRVVAFRELTVSEFETLVKNAGDKNAGWELTQSGLRISLLRDGKEDLSHQKLTGVLLNKRFTTRQLLTLRNAWDRVHLPNEEDLSRVRAMRVVAAS